MSLALGQSTTTFTWDGAALFLAMRETSADALADCAEESVRNMKDDPAVPYETGALQDSLRVAPPGYVGPDDAIIGTGLGSRHPRIAAGEAGAQRRIDLGPSADTEGEARGFVAFEGDDPHLWVGSFLRYSYWVHQGYYNVWAKRNIAGRPYVARHGDDGMRDFARFFNARWAARYGVVS